MNSIFSKKSKDEKDTIDSIASLSHTKWNCKYHIVFTPKCMCQVNVGNFFIIFSNPLMSTVSTHFIFFACLIKHSLLFFKNYISFL